MSSFVWMKVLESAPARYDRGIQLLSRGRIGEIYERVAARVAAPGKRILDVGCGTGGVSLACAARGATVTGIDIDAGMLEVARSKAVPPAGSVEFVELGAAEIEDRFGAESLDAVVSCLAMSELSQPEQDYTLRIAHSRLVPGGHLVIADETRPKSGLRRWSHRVGRWPIVAATYLLTQTTTRPVQGLADRVRAAGFSRVEEERLLGESFVIVSAVKERS